MPSQVDLRGEKFSTENGTPRLMLTLTNTPRRPPQGGTLDNRPCDASLPEIPPEKGPQPGLRVGILTNSYRPVINGVVSSIVVTRSELSRQGHQPYLFAPRMRGGSEDSKTYCFPTVQTALNANYPVPFPFSRSCNQALSSLSLDVLHTHHPFLVANLAVRYRRKLRIPLVYTFHTQYEQYSHYFPWFPQTAARWLVRRVVRRFSRHCDLILAPSPGIHQLLREYGIETWTETLPNAIDLEHFQRAGERQRVRGRLQIEPDEVVGLSVSRLGREKNLAFLLRCFARLGPNPRSRLLIVGEGPEAVPLQRLAEELGIRERVTFLGRVDYETIPQYYAAADYFSITSTTEVKPLAVLEALASGLPVIAVAACGTQDTIIHETDGLLSNPSEEAYSAILEQAVLHGERRRGWSGEARKTSRAYGIENYARRLVGFYREAISRTNASSRDVR